MKKFVLSLLLTLLCSAQSVAAPLSIWGRATASTFRITFDTDDGIGGGTAFCVPGTASLIMTANHVVDEQADSSLMIEDYKGGMHSGRVLLRNKKSDIATILLNDQACAVAPAEWAKELGPPGTPIWAAGYGSLTKGLLLTTGIVSGDKGKVAEAPNGTPAQLNILGGHSGSPVYDSQGRIVGMAVGFFKAYDLMDVIVPVEELRKAIR